MMDDTFDFLPMAILLTTKEEVFAFLDDYDEETYILKDAYRIIRGYSSTGVMKIMYEPFCPYSDDVFTLISKNHVLTTNEMSEYYFQRYLEILNGVETKNESSLDDSDEDFNVELPSTESKSTLH